MPTSEFRVGLDVEATSRAIFGELAKDAARLGEAIKENILRLYNNVDDWAVLKLYGPLLTGLWETCEPLGLLPLEVFTTNWDPAFHALKESKRLPVG